jgi:hypothetical protein
MKKETLKEIVNVLWGVAKKVGWREDSIQFVTSKIVAPVPVPYELKGAIKDKVEFEEVTNPVLRADSDDIPLKVLTLKRKVKAFVGFIDSLENVFWVEVVDTSDQFWEDDPEDYQFMAYDMWDPKAFPSRVNYDDPIVITAIATGLWTLQNLNSGHVFVDSISGSRERVARTIRRMAPELEYIKKFKIR